MANEINREALISYLENLRTLETVKHISEKRFQELERQKNSLFFNENPPAVPISPNLASAIIRLAVLAIIIIGSVLGIRYVFSDCEGLLSYLGAIFFAMIIVGIACGLLGTLISSGLFDGTIKAFSEQKRYNQYKEEYPNLLAQYEQRKTSELSRIENEKRQIQTLQNDIQQEINIASSALGKAYSANIIPLQFRNIQGIYYLYDYLAYSNENLSSGLVQANLEAIKQKLDTMIQQQSEMIIKQEQAHIDQLKHNQQMLDSFQRIENNSRVASQYAQVSALNSETAMLMQKEQLAYQRADYISKKLGTY